MLSIILCFLSIGAFAQNQNNTLKGKIYDAETKEPIIGASIHLLTNPNITSFSNADGSFKIAVNQATDSLKIDYVGYASTTILATNNLRIALKNNALELHSVYVTANREAGLRTQSPVAISKISPKLIYETKASMVFELINKVPGVIMPSYNNEQHGMAIRQPMGTSAYYLYMEDGVPIRPLGIFNHNALLEINQFTIGSIEVVKGPVSSIYGPEAVGGAINFIMQKPTLVPTAKIGIQADNWGFRRLQFGTSAKIGKFGFYLGGLSSKQTNSWMTNSDYDKTSINARLEYNFTDKTRLIGNLIYGKYYSQMAGSVDSAAFYDRKYVSTSDFTYRKSDAYRSRLTLEHDWSNHSKTFITAFLRNNKHGQNPSYSIRWNPVASPTNNPLKAKGEINSNNFESHGVIAQHSQKIDFLKSKLILGGVFDYSTNNYWSHQILLNAQLRPDGKNVERYTIDQIRPDLKIADYNGIIKNSAAYVQYDFEPISKLRFSLGARYDLMALNYKNNVNNTAGNIVYKRFTPKIGATFDLGNDKGLYANYAQGFSPPSLTAIFRPRPNTTPVEFYTNLQPAVFQNYEIGGWASLLKNKLYIDVALYQMNGQNELLNIRQPDNSFDYQSAGKTLHRGIEFGITAKPNTEYSFRFGGTTALHRYENFLLSNKPTDPVQNLAGFEMPSAPRWNWNTELNYYPKWFKNFRSAIEWQYVSSWYQDQVNKVKYKGYNLINFRTGYQYKSVELFTNLMNITNALVANSASRGNNTTDRTTFNPGAPRTFVLGIQYNFAGK
ncbi:MAG: TonB-dependent receptor [Sphingobacteriales bacterium]|nr:MAG: TonB-dependent receptor [Sphingobacteriales bacterium]TAF82726.1 MAG: TonB-dependent receptor [Sphingobacteriales bacterium]